MDIIMCKFVSSKAPNFRQMLHVRIKHIPFEMKIIRAFVDEILSFKLKYCPTDMKRKMEYLPKKKLESNKPKRVKMLIAKLATINMSATIIKYTELIM